MRSDFENMMATMLKDCKGAYRYLAKDNNVRSGLDISMLVQPNVNTLLITYQEASIIGYFR